MINLFVVIVTYGERKKYLVECIDSLWLLKYKKIVIIDNNSAHRVEDVFENISDRILYHRFDKNTGSAYAYKYGIELAYSENAEYVLLLDDDNKLDDQGINALENLLITNNDNSKIYCLNRVDQWTDKKINRSKFLIENNYNSFLDFNIKNKFFKKNTYTILSNEIYSAPFGGMILSRSALSKVGFPNADFYLYADDTEYSLRLRNFGYKLYFVPEIKIFDIEKSWYVNADLSSIDIKLRLSTDTKAYYTNRNNAYISIKYLSKSICAYRLNKYIYLTLLFFRSLIINRLKRFTVIYKAINDGENEKLGVNNDYILK